MRPRKGFLRIVMLAFLATTLALPCFAEPLKKVSIELKWFHQFQFAGIYAAREKGFYKDEGLDVTIVERDTSSNPIQDVLNNKVDFGVSDSTIIREGLLGKKLIILAAIFQHSPLVLITLAKSNLVSPIELKSKKVMFQKNVDDAIVAGMFNEFGINKDDYIFVPHTFKDDALLTGKADAMSAYLSNQPYLYKQKGININIIKPENYGIDFYGDTLFTSKTFFDENKETALAFRRATIRGWEYALDHPEEVISWIKDIYGSKKTHDALTYEAEVIKRMIAAETIPIGEINNQRLEHIAKTYIASDDALKGLSPEKIDSINYQNQSQSDDDYKKIIAVVIIICVVFILTILFLILFNQRLKNKVNERTKKIKNANERLDQYLSIIDSAVMLLHCNKKRKITSVSKALEKTLKNGKESVIGKSITFLSPIFTLKSSEKKKIKQSIKGRTDCAGECVFLDNEDEKHSFEYKLLPTPKIDDDYTMIFIDITEKKHVEELSETDAVTQIANRHRLSKVLAELINKENAVENKVSIIMIDIDHFKRINDQFGHSEGDLVLKNISHLLRKHKDDSLTAGRWGGEEFLLICPNTDLEKATDLAEEIRQDVEKFEFKQNVNVTISLGVAEMKKNENTDEFIERADKALYEAKKSGRNQTKQSKG